MQKITTGNNIKIPIKRKVCIHIGLFLMRIYQPFRACSGVKEHTDKKIKEYEESKEKVEQIEEYAPKIMRGVETLQDRNKYLEARIVVLFEELRAIKILTINNDKDGILELLSKYNLDKKLNY